MFNINGRNWRVLLVPSNFSKLSKHNGVKALGSCDDKTSTIYINRRLEEDKLYHVLCHEITHAAMFSYGIELTLEQEELLADLLATYGQEVIYIANSLFNRIKENRGT